MTEVITAAQQGDRDAFAQLVEHSYDSIYRMAFRYARRTSDAEDITQDACIKLGRFIHQYRFDSAYQTWLYKLVLNCARDWSRRQHDTAPLEDEAPGSQVADAEASVLLDQVMQAVAQMGPEFKETVLLVIGEGFSHADAADILAVAESTVSWRIFEMRKRLKTTFAMEVAQ